MQWRRCSLARLATGIALALLPRPASSRALSRDAASENQGPTPPRSYSLEILRTFPHEGMPFTQGLEVTADCQHLVEASGSYPPGTDSFIRIVDPATGKTVRRVDPDGLSGKFAEGIVQLPNGNWFLSTYLDKKAVEYTSDLQFVKLHEYPTMGWGLTRTSDGGSFLATNGSEHVMTLRKDNFKVVDTKVATCMGKRVSGLNELEMVDNFMGLGPTLLGNLYLSRVVLALDPATAECTGVFHLEGLGQTAPGEASGFHAANGLAYNKTSGTLIVTGKNWDQMYEVRIHEDPAGQASQMLSTSLVNAPIADQKAVLLQVSSDGDSRSFLEAARGSQASAGLGRRA